MAVRVWRFVALIAVAAAALGCGSESSGTLPAQGAGPSAPLGGEQGTPAASSPTPAPGVEPIRSPVATWTFILYGAGGYSEKVTIEAGAVEQYHAGLTNGNAVAGSSCTLDPQTDAVVPVMISAINTTPNFNVPVEVDWGFGHGIMFEGEWGSGGSQCDTGGYDPDLPVASLVGAATGPQSGVALDGFFEFPGYYSPSDPSGDPQMLSGWEISVSANNSETFALGGGGPATGPGVMGIPASGFWLFDLDGSTPPDCQYGLCSTPSPAT
jgi:hypothetical protein